MVSTNGNWMENVHDVEEEQEMAEEVYTVATHTSKAALPVAVACVNGVTLYCHANDVKAPMLVPVQMSPAQWPVAVNVHSPLAMLLMLTVRNDTNAAVLCGGGGGIE